MANCNSYGVNGAFAAICAAISWYLVDQRACKINITNIFSETFNSENLQMFHYIAIAIGLVLFVLSFFDFASVLYEVTILFVVAIAGIFASGVMMLYATYIAFHMSCKSTFNNIIDTASLTGAKNVIEARDEIGIFITVLDLLAACTLISAAISFSRTY